MVHTLLGDRRIFSFIYPRGNGRTPAEDFSRMADLLGVAERALQMEGEAVISLKEKELATAGPGEIIGEMAASAASRA